MMLVAYAGAGKGASAQAVVNIDALIANLTSKVSELERAYNKPEAFSSNTVEQVKRVVSNSSQILKRGWDSLNEGERNRGERVISDMISDVDDITKLLHVGKKPLIGTRTPENKQALEDVIGRVGRREFDIYRIIANMNEREEETRKYRAKVDQRDKDIATIIGIFDAKKDDQEREYFFAKYTPEDLDSWMRDSFVAYVNQDNLKKLKDIREHSHNWYMENSPEYRESVQRAAKNDADHRQSVKDFNDAVARVMEEEGVSDYEAYLRLK